MSIHDKMDLTISYLDLPRDSRPQLITVYAPEVDNMAHEHGIDSEELRGELARVDAAIENLLQGLHNRNLTDVVNIVLVSDHGP